VEQPTSLDMDPTTAGAALEGLLLEIEAGDDAVAKTRAQALVRLLMSLYGAGLSRMLDVVRTEHGGPAAVLDRFAGDGLIANLLVLHDLHPHPVHHRVSRAIAALQPHLPPHISLTVVGTSADTVHVRAESSGAGLPSPNLRASVERAVQEAAPEIATIHIDGLPNGNGLIQIARSSAAQRVS
jgi:hypothetical protein